MSKEAIAHYEAALKEAFPRGATGEVFHHWNEARYLIATEALEKMAENARELGLDYEPEQPKVRTGNCLRVGVCASEGHKIAPQRTWVGLTDSEIGTIAYNVNPLDGVRQFSRAIEAKLKEKNG